MLISFFFQLIFLMGLISLISSLLSKFFHQGDFNQYDEPNQYDKNENQRSADIQEMIQCSRCLAYAPENQVRFVKGLLICCA